MKSLLWKEWHEQRWKLGFGCLVLGTLAAMAYHARMVADLTSAEWICYLGLTLLPILSSTGLIPAERAEGTLEMLQSLPLPRSRWLGVKLAVGLLQVIVPILIAGAVAALACGDREMPAGAMFAIHLRSAATAALLFAWMTALTARLPGEARAALIGVGVLIIWELITVGLHVPSGFAPRVPPHPYEPYYRLLVTPLVFVFGISDDFVQSPPLAASVLAQLSIAAGLFWITLRQVGVNDWVE